MQCTNDFKQMTNCPRTKWFSAPISLMHTRTANQIITILSKWMRIVVIYLEIYTNTLQTHSVARIHFTETISLSLIYSQSIIDSHSMLFYSHKFISFYVDLFFFYNNKKWNLNQNIFAQSQKKTFVKTAKIHDKKKTYLAQISLLALISKLK